MERDYGHDRTTQRPTPSGSLGVQALPGSVRAMREARMAAVHGELVDDEETRLGPVDFDATHVLTDVQTRPRVFAAVAPASVHDTARDAGPVAAPSDGAVTERASLSLPIHPSLGVPPRPTPEERLAARRASLGLPAVRPSGSFRTSAHEAAARPSASFAAARPSASFAAARPSASFAAAGPVLAGAEVPAPGSSLGITRASANLRAAELRAERERLQASFTATPSGKPTLRPPPLDLADDQTLDPPARTTPQPRRVDSLAPSPYAFAALEAAHVAPELRDTARRPLAPPILTQVPGYIRPHAPSSITPMAVATSPMPVAGSSASRLQSLLLAAMLLVGVGATAVMGAATFAPDALAKGRAAATIELDTLLGHPPRASEPAAAEPIFEPAEPIVLAAPATVPPVLPAPPAAEARDAGR